MMVGLVRKWMVGVTILKVELCMKIETSAKSMFIYQA
jgi:hypothetical protein